ncbi:hypothetical protein U3516DRAFT_732382 [Neocallimastix sp. 'constans']
MGIFEEDGKSYIGNNDLDKKYFIACQNRLVIFDKITIFFYCHNQRMQMFEFIFEIEDIKHPYPMYLYRSWMVLSESIIKYHSLVAVRFLQFTGIDRLTTY